MLLAYLRCNSFFFRKIRAVIFSFYCAFVLVVAIILSFYCSCVLVVVSL